MSIVAAGILHIKRDFFSASTLAGLRPYSVCTLLVPHDADWNRFQFSEIHEVRADVRFPAREGPIQDLLFESFRRGVTPSFPRGYAEISTR